jgi:alanine racemase
MEVDLGRLRSNYREIKRLVGSTCLVMGVVKNNAYSLGLRQVASALVAEGCPFLAVATIDEALELRNHVPASVSILVMGPTPTSAASAAVTGNVICACSDLALAEALVGAASTGKGTARVHVKIDTGLGRSGFFPEEAPAAVACMYGMGLAPEGIFSHFAAAEEENLDFAQWQFQRFMSVLKDLEERDIRFQTRHICNSAALARCPEMRLDAVRPGNLLYGYPDKTVEARCEVLPTVEVKTAIVSIRRLPPRSPVSYGLSYVTRGETPVSVLPIGYGDGFVRHMPNPQVLVRGRRIPIIGRICMDQVVADLSSVPDAVPGDEVVVVGRQGDEEISLYELIGKMDTVAGQVLSYFTGRMPRIYLQSDHELSGKEEKKEKESVISECCQTY